MNQDKPSSTRLHGTPVSSGIAIGKVYLLERGKIHVSKHAVKEEQVEKEIGKFRSAIKSAMEELSKVKDSIPDDDVRRHAFIIDAHLLILQDTYFTGDVIDIIRGQRINAEWALEMVVSRFLKSFEKVEDPYLRERGRDLDQIYQRLLRIMVKEKTSGVAAKGIRGRVIIVAPDLSPADTIQLNLHKVSGFVTDVGGRTSHTSIVARALEIPAVVGLATVTSLVKNNDTMVIDAMRAWSS
jgi:phosphotransferase system enzyme I (PtsI)